MNLLTQWQFSNQLTTRPLARLVWSRVRRLIVRCKKLRRSRRNDIGSCGECQHMT